MSASLNKAFLMGKVGQAAEFKFLANGSPMCKLRLATGRSSKSGAEWVETTDWHTLTGFGRLAMAMSVCDKGDDLCVECEIRQEKYTNREQRLVYTTNIVVREILYHHVRGTPFAETADAPPDDTPPPTDDDYR